MHAFRPGKILALGRTYRAHAVELGNAPPPEPLVFNKLPDTVVPTGAVVEIPADAQGTLDHEVKLVKGAIFGNNHPAPNRRLFDIFKLDFELIGHVGQK